MLQSVDKACNKILVLEMCNHNYLRGGVLVRVGIVKLRKGYYVGQSIIKFV